MGRLTYPDNRFDIKTPILRSSVRLKTCAEVYPSEFKGRNVTTRDKKEKYSPIYIYPITPGTSFRARDALEVIAHYFRREFGYDGPGYEAEARQDRQDRIFLVVEGESWAPERYAVGAIVFRWFRYSDAPEQLVLHWTWLHPFLRRAGIFTTYWNIFREVYGDFHVDYPHSKAMDSFLTKMQEIKPLLPD